MDEMAAQPQLVAGCPLITQTEPPRRPEIPRGRQGSTAGRSPGRRLRPRHRSCWSAHTTVRDWLRGVGRAVPALTAQAVSVAGTAGEADACGPQPPRPCSALTSAVNAWPPRSAHST